MAVKALRTETLSEVVRVLNKLYPLKYADNSWDNTGLLLDNSIGETSIVDERETTDLVKVLVTVDLTTQVANEAIQKGANLVIAYHPFLFRKFNRIGKDDPQQQSLLALCRNNISVYSPHTAVDAAVDGVNDWLSMAVAGGFKDSLNTNTPIVADASGDADVGMGRILELSSAISYEELAQRMKKALNVSHVQVGIPPNAATNAKNITKVAVCAGSGGSLFTEKYVNQCDALVTGELSHHELLAHVQRGRVVILAGHCNTERAFVLGDMTEAIKKALVGEQTLSSASVVASSTDASPFVTV